MPRTVDYTEQYNNGYFSSTVADKKERNQYFSELNYLQSPRETGFKELFKQCVILCQNVWYLGK